MRNTRLLIVGLSGHLHRNRDEGVDIGDWELFFLLCALFALADDGELFTAFHSSCVDVGSVVGGVVGAGDGDDDAAFPVATVQARFFGCAVLYETAPVMC